VLLIIPILLGYGTVLIIDHRRKNDYIRLTEEGIFFKQKGESGFMPWDSIKEIEGRRHSSGTDYLIITNNCVLTFNKEIEPAITRNRSFLERFLFNYGYAEELVSQIRKMATHARFKEGI
jgi:hypothetical protein